MSTEEESSSSSSSKRLDGKVAIVTGGTSGAGEAAVRLFAAHGATVVVADVNDSPGAAILSPELTFVRCDITSEEEIEALINSTVSKYGSIHVFFNNAGIIGGGEIENRSILDFDAAEFDRIATVSVRGTALGIKHAARAMIGAGARGGSIICTASAAAVWKQAIVGLVKNAACELGRFGIRVNCISASGVWEEDGGGGAEAAARGGAEAAVFLASVESKYISGHNLVVDGGLRLTTSNNFSGF